MWQLRATTLRAAGPTKNDQAYVEQKNWTAVRQIVGYDRYEGEPAWLALQARYHSARLYLNFFQPVMVLVEKQRLGAKAIKRYDVPKTPYLRSLEVPEIDPAAKARLRQRYDALNPAELLRQIHRRQAALWRLACPPAVLGAYSCGDPARRNLIVGGQGVRVEVASGAIAGIRAPACCSISSGWP